MPDIGHSTWNLYNSRTEEERSDVSVSSHLLGKFSSEWFKSKILFGVDYSRISENSATRLEGPVGAVDLLSPGSWPAYFRPSGLPAIEGDNVYRTYGAFAQLQTTVADRLHLLGGLRLARLEIDQHSPTMLRRDDTAKTKLLPRVGAVFDLTSQFSIFADYSEGMKGNPFYLYSGPALPEVSRQYEAGIKFDLDYGLSGSAAAFQIERSNVPVSDPSDPYRLTSLAAGEQRSRGFDTEITWQSDSHWKIMANYAYVDADLTRDIPGGAQAGNKLAAIPRHSGGLWIDYSFGDGFLSGWSAGAGLYAASGAPLNLENTYKAEAYITADAAIRYKKDGFSAGIVVKNITDEKYYLPYMYLIGGVASAPGRTALLNVTQRF
jgi:iron complex outermembrane receptor protein